MSKIFVSIACFMDIDILNTIDNCLEKAKNPNNLIFGICFQSDDNDLYLDKYKDNTQFRIKNLHWSQAKGPAYARGIIFDMFNDEDYFFQIDCHTRFYHNWDEILINCFNECKKINDKTIISYYPININNMMDNDSKIYNISTVRTIDINNGIKTHARRVQTTMCPMKSWGISAAMLFFDKKAYYDVPFDKEIYFGLQFEEQVVLAARYWTNGYDIFTPSKHIVATEYETNRKRQKNHVLIKKTLKEDTYNRLCHIMKLKYNCKYNDSKNNKLGNIRKIEDYYKMLGIYEKVKEVYPENYLEFQNNCVLDNNDSVLDNNDSVLDNNDSVLDNNEVFYAHRTALGYPEDCSNILVVKDDFVCLNGFYWKRKSTDNVFFSNSNTKIHEDIKFNNAEEYFTHRNQKSQPMDWSNIMIFCDNLTINSGFYWKRVNNGTVYFSYSCLNIQQDISFDNHENYYAHRVVNGHPADWSNIFILDDNFICDSGVYWKRTSNETVYFSKYSWKLTEDVIFQRCQGIN